LINTKNLVLIKKTFFSRVIAAQEFIFRVPQLFRAPKTPSQNRVKAFSLKIIFYNLKFYYFKKYILLLFTTTIFAIFFYTHLYTYIFFGTS